nr:uncharacterized protein LOC105843290 isoform X3 [Hydra vulgaris]
MLSRRKRGTTNSIIEDFLGSGKDPSGIKVTLINSDIGYGVVSTKKFEKGDFLLEYAGEKISEFEALQRDKKYKKNKIGCFIYYNIIGSNGKFCIDATYSTQAGRYVNDSPFKYANAVMKRYVLNQSSYLALFAIKAINIGTEIRYDYGDDPKEMPWRNNVENLQPSSCYTENESTLVTNTSLIDVFAVSSSKIENELVVNNLSNKLELEVFKLEDGDLLFSDVEDSEEENSYSEILYNCSCLLESNDNYGSKKTVVLGEKDSTVLPLDSTVLPLNSTVLPESINSIDKNNETSFVIKKNIQSKKKIHRPCPLCKDGKFQSALTRYLKLCHKDEPTVKKALSLPKREQIEAFALLRKNGIFNHNLLEMKKEVPKFIRERKANDHHADGDNLVICAACKGCYAKPYKARHQIYCGRDNGQVMIPLMPIEAMVRIDSLDNNFKAVINKMIQDDISALAKSDPIIIMIGARIYKANKCKKEKKFEVEKRVRGTMRQLARLYSTFKNSLVSSFDASDMFKKENISHLNNAIRELTEDINGMKSGLKVHLQNVIKRVANMVQVHFMVESRNKEAEMVRDFISIFSVIQHELFGDALYQLHQKRNKSTRKPANLPDNQALKLLQNYLSEVVDSSFFPLKFPSSVFVDVRDAACTRLTIFNVRRGGEPARLFIYQWKEAIAGTWLVEATRRSYIDEISTGNRITFQEGKGNKLVPVFIPPDLVSAIEFVSSEAARKDSGIAPENQYLFPSTNGSDNHVSGWHVLVSCCKKANVDGRLTGTMNRHRVSSLIGALGLSESNQQLVYDHFGHSGDVNKNIYQVPQAEQQLRTTGQFLRNIDQGLSDSSSSLYSDLKIGKLSTIEDLKPEKTRDAKRYASLSINEVEDEDEDIEERKEDTHRVKNKRVKSEKIYFQWTECQKRLFAATFQSFIARDKGFPSRDKMNLFADKNEIPQNCIRTRIVNERALRKNKANVYLKQHMAMILYFCCVFISVLVNNHNMHLTCKIFFLKDGLLYLRQLTKEFYNKIFYKELNNYLTSNH